MEELLESTGAANVGVSGRVGYGIAPEGLCVRLGG